MQFVKMKCKLWKYSWWWNLRTSYDSKWIAPSIISVYYFYTYSCNHLSFLFTIFILIRAIWWPLRGKIHAIRCYISIKTVCNLSFFIFPLSLPLSLSSLNIKKKAVLFDKIARFTKRAPPCGWLRRGQNAHCIMGKCRQTNAAQDTK